MRGPGTILSRLLQGSVLFFVIVAISAGDTLASSPTQVLAAPDGPDVREITLITGDVVQATTSTWGVQQLNVLPRGIGYRGTFRTVTNDQGTYVFPGDADLERLDRELFNVTYLLQEDFDSMYGLPVIITAADDGYLEAIAAEVQHHGGIVTFRFPRLSMLAAQLSKVGIGDASGALLRGPEVKKIWLDSIVHVSLSDSVPLIGAPAVWETGLHGDGIKIAILDTGIDAAHPDLDDLDDDPGTNDPKVLIAVNFSSDATTDDLNGHGTHMGGTAAGTGAAALLPTPTPTPTPSPTP